MCILICTYIVDDILIIKRNITIQLSSGVMQGLKGALAVGKNNMRQSRFS